MISARTKICMVIGHPVIHSLSPLLHNTGYSALGLADEFVYVGCDVQPEAIADFVTGVRAAGIRGVSCTMPCKELVSPYLDTIDATARTIGAVNTIVNQDGQLHGYNTDWIGVIAPLQAITTLKSKKVAILGAGGTAKAAAYGLSQAGADVTLYNRTLSKAQALAQKFDCQFAALDADADLSHADIICNTTPVSMNKDASPLNRRQIASHHIVMDAVYHPYNTKLLLDAAASGAQVVHGTEMLLHQAMAQFKLYTGHDAPEDAMRRALLTATKDKEA